MSLAEQIAQFRSSFLDSVPSEIQAAMQQATDALSETGIASRAPNFGDVLPEFNLTNQHNEFVSLGELTARGPVVVTFYRGGWCPYCNLELRAYQAVADQINEAGATLVAITPELPDASLNTIEKNQLNFQVLSDVGAAYAKHIGVAFSLADELRPIYSSFGLDLETYNGAGQFDLPLAATYVVDRQGKIVSAFVDADYTKRQDPDDVLMVLKNLAP